MNNEWSIAALQRWINQNWPKGVRSVAGFAYVPGDVPAIIPDHVPYVAPQNVRECTTKKELLEELMELVGIPIDPPPPSPFDCRLTEEVWYRLHENMGLGDHCVHQVEITEWDRDEFTVSTYERSRRGCYFHHQEYGSILFIEDQIRALIRGYADTVFQGIDLEEVKWDRLAQRFWQQYADRSRAEKISTVRPEPRKKLTKKPARVLNEAACQPKPPLLLRKPTSSRLNLRRTDPISMVLPS